MVCQARSVVELRKISRALMGTAERRIDVCRLCPRYLEDGVTVLFLMKRNKTRAKSAVASVCALGHCRRISHRRRQPVRPRNLDRALRENWPSRMRKSERVVDS